MKRIKAFDKRIAVVTILFCVLTYVMIDRVHHTIGGHTSVTRYYLVKDYRSNSHLFHTLIEKPSKLFLWCCDCILYYAKELGITYEELNIYAFVIVQPMLIAFLLCIAVIQTIKVMRCQKV